MTTEGSVDLCQHLEGLAKSRNDFRASSIAERLIRYSKGGRVLDAGCGIGLLSLRLRREGNEVVSVDGEPAMVGLTRATLAASGFADADVRQLTLERLDELGGQKFDEIYCCDVIEHIENDALAVRKLRSMLEPDGRLILTVPAHQFLFNERDNRMGHYRRYSREALTRVISEAGFEIRTVRWWNMSGFLLNAAASPFARMRKKGFSEKFRYGNRSWPSRLGHWLLGRWFHVVENHVPVPVGLTLIVVADRGERIKE